MSTNVKNRLQNQIVDCISKNVLRILSFPFDYDKTQQKPRKWLSHIFIYEHEMVTGIMLILLRGAEF